MDDRRIAEWLSVDHPLGEGDDEAEFESDGEDLGEAAASPPRASPIPQRRAAMVGFEGQGAYVVQLIGEVARRIRRRPLTALAVGAGIGFVIGGALSFRTGRLLLAAGARHVVRDLLKQLL